MPSFFNATRPFSYVTVTRWPNAFEATLERRLLSPVKNDPQAPDQPSDDLLEGVSGGGVVKGARIRWDDGLPCPKCGFVGYDMARLSH